MYPKEFFKQKVTQKKGQCFVMMPFAAQFNEVYRTIQDALEGPEIGFSCVRADQLFGGGHIIADILRCIAESEIVIGDLTTRNPNVFYELGVAHTVKDLEKVFILTQDINDVPFDLRPFRCITYEQNDPGMRQLHRSLIDSVKVVSKIVYRFVVDHNGSYRFEQQLSGKDGCFYTFEMPELWVSPDAVKFRLIVYRYAIGEPVETIHDEAHFLSSGNLLSIPNIPWQLVIDKVVPNSKAYLRMVAE